MADKVGKGHYGAHEPGPAVIHSVPTPNGHSAEPYTNPEVRYERTDVEMHEILIFVAGLIACLGLSGAFLIGMFWYLENRELAVKKSDVPLAETERDRMPSGPRLEGIEPTKDMNSAWPVEAKDDARFWPGYHIHLVPHEGNASADPDMEKMNVETMKAAKNRVEQIDSTLNKMAGKLPVRAKPREADRDEFRRSAGEGNAGRAAGESKP